MCIDHDDDMPSDDTDDEDDIPFEDGANEQLAFVSAVITDNGSQASLASDGDGEVGEDNGDVVSRWTNCE